MKKHGHLKSLLSSTKYHTQNVEYIAHHLHTQEQEPTKDRCQV